MASINSTVLARRIQTGKVFARFQFAPGEVEALVEDLNFAANPAVIRSAARVEEVGHQILDYLKANFPSQNRSAAAAFSENKLRSSGVKLEKRPPLKLREGWQVKFYTATTANALAGSKQSGSSLWGFFIEHERAKNERISTILRSLEGGSTGYFIKPVRKKSLFFSVDYPPTGMTAHSKGHEIPAREGFGFMEATDAYASDLLAKTGTRLETEIARIIEKGKRYRSVVSGLQLDRNNLRPELAQAVRSPAVISALAKQRNPLKRLRILGSRRSSSRYQPSG
jgi:hypothetical protein